MFSCKKQGKGDLYCWHRISYSVSLTSMLTSATLTGMSTSAPTVIGTSTSTPLAGMLTSAPLTGMSTSAPLTGMSTSAHPTCGALISASPTGTLTSGPSHRKYKCTLSHVDMSALLLKLQTEREKREALEHEVDIIKGRLEERSVVQNAADYKQTLFSEMLHVQLYLHTGTEATHRQYNEGCLLPHVPSFPCNSHRHPSCVIAELLRGRSREQVTSLAVHVWQLAPPTASSSVTSQCQTMSTRSSSVKRCLPNASSSVDHVPKSLSLCGVKGHTWNYCAEEGEPGDEARFWEDRVDTAKCQKYILHLRKVLPMVIENEGDPTGY